MPQSVSHWKILMLSGDQSTQLQDIIGQAQTVLVFLGSRPTYDSVASAVSLAQVLQQQGKNVQVVAPLSLQIETDGILGVEQITTELGNRDLQVSFPYTPEQVDKVSYHVDEERQTFSLVIKPQAGVKPLDSTLVTMSYAGAEADLVMFVGVNELEDLESFSLEYPELFESTSSISFHTYETVIGNIKINSSAASCLSEKMTEVLKTLGWEVSSDSATNLLAAIERQTDGFRSLATTAETFEAVAFLLRAGARRIKRAPKSTENVGAQPDTSSKPAKKPKANPPKQLAATDPKPGGLGFTPSQLK